PKPSHASSPLTPPKPRNPPRAQPPPREDAAARRARAGGGARRESSPAVATTSQPPTTDDVLLRVDDLYKHFPITKGLFKRVVGQVKAVDGVSFEIPEGKTLGLVGESGCGKTTTSRMIMRAFDPTSGHIWFRDRQLGWVDIPELGPAELKRIRPDMQMIFQDPYSSLNPRMTLLEIIGEPLLVNGIARGEELRDRVADMLRRVGLRPEYVNRYPHGFSG